MKAVEFTVAVSPEGQIQVPSDLAGQLPLGAPVQVLLLWSESDEDHDDGGWQAAGRERFENAYAPEDAVYESLIDDSSSR